MAENTSQTGGYSAVSQNSVAIEGIPVKAQQSSDSAPRHNVFEDIGTSLKQKRQAFKEWHIKDTPYVQAMHPEELKTKELWMASGAEFLGVAFFIYIFQRIFKFSVELWGGFGAGCFLTILLMAALFIVPLFYVFGSLSGAHLNPAITWAVFATRRISFIRAAIYTIAQLIGSAIGAAIAMGTVHPLMRKDYNLATCTVAAAGLNVMDDEYLGGVFLLELFQTFVVVFIAFGLAFDPRGWGKAAPYGIIAFYIVLVYCGGCMNPAVAFGPSLINAEYGQRNMDNNYQHLWIFIIAPVIGGVCAGLFYENVYMFREDHVAPVPSQVGNSHDHHENFGIKPETLSAKQGEKIMKEMGLQGA